MRTDGYPAIPIPRPGQVARALIGRLGGRGQARVIEASTVGRVLDRFGLEPLGLPRNVPGEWRNRNLLVDTSSGLKVLRCYRRRWPAETILHEHALLEHLAGCGFPAPRLAATPQNETLVTLDGERYALFDFIEGISHASALLWPGQRARLMEAAGRLLARLHREMEGAVPQARHHLAYTSDTGERQYPVEWYLRTLDELPSRSGALTGRRELSQVHWLAARSGYLQERIVRLEERLADADLPQVVIHGDYGLHNLLFGPDGSITVLDFELARRDRRLDDLIIALSRLDRRVGGRFLAGYQAEWPLTNDERRLLREAWQSYLLRGAVRYWHNTLEMGGVRRLTAARRRILQARQVEAHPRARARPVDEISPPGAERPPRVMMVARLFHPWVGGTERQAQKLAKELGIKGVPVSLVTGWWFRGTPQRDVVDGVPMFRNGTLWEFWGIPGLRWVGGYLYILTLIWHLWRRRHDYDLVHVHGLNYHTFASVVAGRWLGRPVLCKLANSGPASDLAKMREGRQLAGSRHMLSTALRCDRLVALNPRIREELTAAGVPSSRIVELPNGVETEELAPKESYALHDPPRLLYLGRLHPQKHLSTLLKALQRLQQGRQDVRLQLLGDGPDRQRLEHLATELGIEQQVEFWGQTDGVAEHLRAADLLVLPSAAEGLSNALLEAMACGLPVVVSDIAGNADLIQQGWNGLLFPVGDPEALAQCLTRLLRDGALRARLGQAARQTVEERFSLSAVADSYIGLYRELLAGAVPAAARQLRPVD